MEADGADTAAEIAELIAIAKANSPLDARKLESPALTAIRDQSANRFTTLHELVVAATSRMSEPERSAGALLFAEGPDRWVQSLGTRQKLACEMLGTSYHNFRRQRGGGPSPYETLASMVVDSMISVVENSEAAQEAETSPGYPRPSRAAEPVEEALRDRRRAIGWPLVAAILVMVAGGALWAATRQQDEPLIDGTRAEPVTTPNGEHDVEPVESPIAEDLEEQVSKIGCALYDETEDSDVRAAAAAIQTELAQRGLDDCVRDGVALRGGLYWYEISTGQRQEGGAIAVPDGVDLRVVVLPLGPWQSYRSIGGGGDGSRAADVAGVPTGEIVESHGGFSMLLDGHGYMHGESDFGKFYWMPEIGYETWLDMGAESGPLGPPASSLYVDGGGYRLDFENGFLRQLGDGSIEAGDREDDPVDLPEDIGGRLISARDGTGWFVDNELRRWWIPNSQTWFCAGGHDNAVAHQLPGHAIHELEYGGVAPCPLRGTGTYPRNGELEIARCCQDLLGDLAEADRGTDRWFCNTPLQQIAVEPSDVCLWQFGPNSELANLDDIENWRCHSNSDR